MKKKLIFKQLIFVFSLLQFYFTYHLVFCSANAVKSRWASILSMDLRIVFDGNEGSVAGASMKQSSASIF